MEDAVLEVLADANIDRYCEGQTGAKWNGRTCGGFPGCVTKHFHH